MKQAKSLPEPQITARHPDGTPADMSILDREGIAYDPTQMLIDLTKAEKRRTTALLMAIQAYSHLIIKDAEYLREAHLQARSNNGPVIQPATMDAMVEAAIDFDRFISGEFSTKQAEIPEDESLALESPKPETEV